MLSMLPLLAAARQSQAGVMRNAPTRSRPRADARHTLIYAAQATPGLLGLQPYRLRDKVTSRALGASLDRQLAAGHAPEETRLLAARAQDIVAPHRREALARYWEHALAKAALPPSAPYDAAPLARGPVLATEPAIRELARLLRAPQPVTARGVAMARLLLTDAGSPLYRRAAPESLHAALRAAIAQLDPALPLMAEDTGR
jgi:hypothetical protein